MTEATDSQKYAELSKMFGGAVRRVTLGRLSHMGVGGEGLLAEIHDADNLKRFVRFHGENGWSFMPLGGASNLLFPDSPFGPTLLRLSGDLAMAGAGGPRAGARGLVCGAGLSAAGLLAASVGASLSGLEILSGLPGSVGGAVAGNAGAFGAGLAEMVTELTVVTPMGETVTLERKDLSVAYRSFALPASLAGSVITEAVFGLVPGDGKTIRERARQNALGRKASQPLDARSLGCVFKNPGARSAGELIDLCGLKGRKLGGAEVSGKHANFIINVGDATSGDVLGLAGVAREAVREKFGEELSLEIKALDGDGNPIGPRRPS
jgi:UDP-N-acetylmuramate dehydrogenase